MTLRTLPLVGLLWFAAAALPGQDLTQPVPQRLELRSRILNETRILWVHTPPGYQAGKDVYPVLYQTDAPGHLNEIGSTIDFLVSKGRMPPVIVVGIGHADRVRDLTPSRSGFRNPDGSLAILPTSGGADRFLDFIQQELLPEIQKRYRTAPYRIFAGHSLGGLFAIHALLSRPSLFDACIAVSPSLDWDGGVALERARQVCASQGEFNKILFFSLADEASHPNQMGASFERFKKILAEGAPKGMRWGWALYPDEDHGSTVLRAHYAGLRAIFSDWQPRTEPGTGLPGGGLAGLEQHYQMLSQRYGCRINPPEATLNNLGYQLLALDKPAEAIAALERNADLHPESANVHDSLGEALAAAGQLQAAIPRFQKAVDLARKNHEGALLQFQAHLAQALAKWVR